MGIYDQCEKDVKNCRPHSLKPEDGLLRNALSLRHVLSLRGGRGRETNVTKRAPMPSRFVTNDVVTNRAGIAPFFSHLGISTCDIVSVTCVCVGGWGWGWGCVRACVHQKERKSHRERDRGI